MGGDTHHGQDLHECLKRDGPRLVQQVRPAQAPQTAATAAETAACHRDRPPPHLAGPVLPRSGREGARGGGGCGRSGRLGGQERRGNVSRRARRTTRDQHRPERARIQERAIGAAIVAEYVADQIAQVGLGGAHGREAAVQGDSAVADHRRHLVACALGVFADHLPTGTPGNAAALSEQRATFRRLRM